MIIKDKGLLLTLEDLRQCSTVTQTFLSQIVLCSHCGERHFVPLPASLNLPCQPTDRQTNKQTNRQNYHTKQLCVCSQLMRAGCSGHIRTAERSCPEGRERRCWSPGHLACTQIPTAVLASCPGNTEQRASDTGPCPTSCIFVLALSLSDTNS